MTYRIKHWETFEHPSEGRRPAKAMDWSARPTTLTSKGRLRLLRMGDIGFRALVVFDSIVSLLAQRPIHKRDGRITNSDDTPIEPQDLADAIHVDVKIVNKSLEVLSSKEIAWIENENLTNSVKTCQDVTKLGATGQDITRQDKTERIHVVAGPPVPAETVPADKPRATKKPSSRIGKAPDHEIGAVLAVWDRVYVAIVGSPYIRTNGAKEAATAKRMIAAAKKAGLPPGTTEGAMRRFCSDAFYRGKDFAVFVSKFSEFTAPKRGGKAERFTASDPLIGDRYGDGRSDGGLPALFARGLPNVEPNEGNGGGMGRLLIDVPGSSLGGSSAPDGQERREVSECGGNGSNHGADAGTHPSGGAPTT